jgi:membrane-bound lytic murein transglycosylase A
MQGFEYRSAGERNKWALSFAEKPWNWTWPMFTLLRGLLLFIPVTLATFAAPEGTEARRYSSASLPEVHSIAGASSPKGATTVDPPSGRLRIPNAALESVKWSDLDGWAGDDHASAFATFYASCRPILRASALRADAAQIHQRDQPVRLQPIGNARKRPIQPQPDASVRSIRPQPPSALANSRPVQSALEQVCARAVRAGRLDPKAARLFFEANFVPVRIRKLGDPSGFLTGYYEPIVDGSRFPTREFTVPLYRRPRDLVAPGVAPGAPFPNTGQAFRQTPTGDLVPYYDRGEIEDGALDGQHLEICWLRSAADALSVQIEGSARVRLEDGTLLRISYDAHNGYPFVPVSRLLIERRLVAREEMSIQRIREWMHNNPDEAKTVRRQNRQVVFFRMAGLNDDTEAIGAQGIPLTAGRSIAVDKALHAYGTPFFIEADLPLPGAPSQSPFRRLMIAQDTGSAIVGPARADLFFGAGEEAGKLAGRIQQSGRFAMLVPRELGSSVTSASVPLPPTKPVPSLASLAFRPVASRAKPEPSLAAGSFRPATLHPVVSQGRPEPSQFAARSLRPVMPPSAKPEPPQVAARTLRPGTLHPVAPSPAKTEPPPAKSEPSRITAHMLRTEEPPPPTKSRPLQVAARATLHPVEPPPAKHEQSQIAARTLRAAEQPPPARPRPSQVAVRALQPLATPNAAKSERSEAGARVLHPAALAPTRTGLSKVASRARQSAASLGAQEAPRRAVRYEGQ